MRSALLALLLALVASGCTSRITAEEYVAAHAERVTSLDARIGQEARSFDPGTAEFDTVRREALLVIFEIDRVHRGIYGLETYGEPLNQSHHARLGLADGEGLPLPHRDESQFRFRNAYFVFQSTSDILGSGSTFLCGDRSCSEFTSARSLEGLRSLVT